MPEGPKGGRKGKPKASVHKVFTNRLRDLYEQAKKMQNAQQGKYQRAWMIPTDMNKSTLDIAAMHEPAFDREEINNEYEQVTKDVASAGTTGDLISLKLQMDYVAAEERAFRARHTTLCRAMCLSHGRRYGQGHGALFGGNRGIEAQIGSFLAAGIGTGEET